MILQRTYRAWVIDHRSTKRTYDEQVLQWGWSLFNFIRLNDASDTINRVTTWIRTIQATIYEQQACIAQLYSPVPRCLLSTAWNHSHPPPRSRLASRWLVDSLVKPGHVVTWQPPAASSWFSALVYSTVIHLVSCELFWSLCKPVTDNAFRNIRIHISQSSIPARFEEIHVGAWVHSTLQEKEWRQTQQTSPCPPLQGAAAPDIFSNMMPIPLPICRASFIAIAENTVFL